WVYITPDGPQGIRENTVNSKSCGVRQSHFPKPDLRILPPKPNFATEPFWRRPLASAPCRRPCHAHGSCGAPSVPGSPAGAACRKAERGGARLGLMLDRRCRIG